MPEEQRSSGYSKDIQLNWLEVQEARRIELRVRKYGSLMLYGEIEIVHSRVLLSARRVA